MFGVREVLGRSAEHINPRTTVAVLEAVIVIALAAQAARLVWRVAEPVGPFGSTAAAASAPRSPAPDLAILARFDPFYRGIDPSAGPGPTAGSAAGDLRLFGVRSDGRGGGSAILGGADGRQTVFLVGETVAPGVVLRAVAADHVVLARGGASQRVDFPAPVPGIAPPPPAPQAAPVMGSAIDPTQLLDGMSLTPRQANGQITGYRVGARGRSGALGLTGLQEGDVLLAVEGNPLNPERLAELPGILEQADEVELRVERAGQILTTKLKMAGR